MQNKPLISFKLSILYSVLKDFNLLDDSYITSIKLLPSQFKM